jgi:hypothetical protein
MKAASIVSSECLNVDEGCMIVSPGVSTSMKACLNVDEGCIIVSRGCLNVDEGCIDRESRVSQRR